MDVLGETSREERNEPWMTEPKGKKRKLDDPAERKETKNGQPSRQKRNEKWTTQPKGKKRKMYDLAER